MDEDLKSFIETTLVDLDSPDWLSIEKAFSSLGVKHLSDFKFLEANDLMNQGVSLILARKLIAAKSEIANEASQTINSPASLLSPDSLSPASPVVNQSSAQNSSTPNSSTPVSADQSKTPNSLTDIDWQAVGHQNWLQSEVRMNPKQITMICNIITTQLIERNHNRRLPEQICSKVARAMSEKFPIHFLDNLLPNSKSADFVKTKISQQSDYKTRGGNRKRRIELSFNGNENCRKKQKTKSDEYGCIEWATSIYPPGENESSLREKQQQLIAISKQAPSTFDNDQIASLMNFCYKPLRDDLNKFIKTETIKEEWPFLFSSRVGMMHFKRLTGVDCFESVRTFAGSRVDLIFNFLKTHSKKPLVTTQIIKVENETQQAWTKHVGAGEMSTSYKLIAVLQALAIFFEEAVLEKIIFLKKVRGFA